MPTDKPLLSITGFAVIVYRAERFVEALGYLRLGTLVPRSDAAVSTKAALAAGTRSRGRLDAPEIGDRRLETLC